MDGYFSFANRAFFLAGQPFLDAVLVVIMLAIELDNHFTGLVFTITDCTNIIILCDNGGSVL